MIGAEWIGVLRLLGPLAGLWSLWAGGRPQVSAIAEPFYSTGARFPYLSVRNPTKFTIRITSITVDPARFCIMSDHSINSAAQAIMYEPANAYVEPEQEARFPIILPDWISDENREALNGIVVRWHSLRSPKIPQLPVTYRITVRDLEDLGRGNP